MSEEICKCGHSMKDHGDLVGCTAHNEDGTMCVCFSGSRFQKERNKNVRILIDMHNKQAETIRAQAAEIERLRNALVMIENEKGVPIKVMEITHNALTELSK